METETHELMQMTEIAVDTSSVKLQLDDLAEEELVLLEEDSDYERQNKKRARKEGPRKKQKVEKQNSTRIFSR